MADYIDKETAEVTQIDLDDVATFTQLPTRDEWRSRYYDDNSKQNAIQLTIAHKRMTCAVCGGTIKSGEQALFGTDGDAVHMLAYVCDENATDSPKAQAPTKTTGWSLTLTNGTVYSEIEYELAKKRMNKAIHEAVTTVKQRELVAPSFPVNYEQHCKAKASATAQVVATIINESSELLAAQLRTSRRTYSQASHAVHAFLSSADEPTNELYQAMSKVQKLMILDEIDYLAKRFLEPETEPTTAILQDPVTCQVCGGNIARGHKASVVPGGYIHYRAEVCEGVLESEHIQRTRYTPTTDSFMDDITFKQFMDSIPRVLCLPAPKHEAINISEHNRRVKYAEHRIKELQSALESHSPGTPAHKKCAELISSWRECLQELDEITQQELDKQADKVEAPEPISNINQGMTLKMTSEGRRDYNKWARINKVTAQERRETVWFVSHWDGKLALLVNIACTRRTLVVLDAKQIAEWFVPFKLSCGYSITPEKRESLKGTIAVYHDKWPRYEVNMLLSEQLKKDYDQRMAQIAKAELGDGTARRL